MYEDYMQNFLNYPMNNCEGTYDPMMDNYSYSNMCSCNNPNMYDYGPSNPYMYGYNFNAVNMNNMTDEEIEDCYPEIYKIVYPMVKKVCLKNRGPLNKKMIDDMVEEVCNNVETNDRIELNVTINNDIKGNTKVENRSPEPENRQQSRNSGLNDLVRILILRELLGRPGNRPNRPGWNQRPNPRPPMRPPYPRYEI